MSIVLHAPWEIVRSRVAAAAGCRYLLASDEAAVCDAMLGAEALVIPVQFYSDAIGRAVARAPCLKWVQVLSAGFDRVQRHGVPPQVVVTNASEALSPSVAVHASTLILALQRGLPQVFARHSRSEWRADFQTQLSTPAESVLLIIGFGAIGREVARLMRPFGPRIIGVSRSAAPHPLADETVSIEQLDRLLPLADSIVVATPLNPSTRGLINRARLLLCKRTAILVNVARGPVVDTDALADALEAGHLGGAGVDVTDPEPLPSGHRLWGAPNVIITPHIAAACGDLLHRRMADLACANIERFKLGQSLHGIVMAGSNVGVDQ